ncbi:hypothetical protein VNO77_08662 [Canavalia gladiata]|uniref:Uncharacterized protein n=1 Tax=Canavalia gladiata TaxID=3824 RepID=A0AAN9QTV6_CANGL
MHGIGFVAVFLIPGHWYLHWERAYHGHQLRVSSSLPHSSSLSCHGHVCRSDSTYSLSTFVRRGRRPPRFAVVANRAPLCHGILTCRIKSNFVNSVKFRFLHLSTLGMDID